MLPNGSCLTWGETKAAGPDYSPIRAGALHPPRHLGGTGQVINQCGMAHWGFGRFKRRLFDNRAVQGTPAHSRAMNDQPVAGPKRPAMRFVRRKDRKVGERHASSGTPQTRVDYNSGGVLAALPNGAD